MLARLAALYVAAFFLASPANAAQMEVHGTILLPAADPLKTGVYDALLHDVLEETGLHDQAGDLIPQGVLFYDIHGVEAGDSFTLVADDGQEPFIVGTADTCPAPGPDLTSLDWWLNDSSLFCNYNPDFDAFFEAGVHGNMPGNEAAIVPADGEVVIVLFFGDLNEGFTYTES